jgi:DNA-binding response OmpR family regulator
MTTQTHEHVSGRRVLLVESEPPVAYILQRALEGMGCSVVVSSDGLEALARGSGDDFDLAIVAHHLPGLLGTEVLTGWRTAGVDHPVIILSEVASEEAVVRALDLGASDFIAKPFRVGEVLARARAVLRDRHRTLSL